MTRFARLFTLTLLAAVYAGLLCACGGGGGGESPAQFAARMKKEREAREAKKREQEMASETGDESAGESGDTSGDEDPKKDDQPDKPTRKVPKDVLDLPIEYKANKAKLEQIEKDLMGLNEGGRDLQRKVESTILEMDEGKGAVPALLNAFRKLDHDDYDQRGIGNFINDMLNRIYLMEPMIQYDPVQETEAAQRSRLRTVRRWFQHYYQSAE